MALEAAREQTAALKGRKNPKGIFWVDSNGRDRPERVPEDWAEWRKAAGIDREVRRYPRARMPRSNSDIARR